MKTVTFYHSMFCPRCQMAGWSLSQLQRDFPDVVVEKVELLANLGRAREEGVRLIPTLVSGDRKLSGVYLTKAAIRRFMEAV
jgi:predicted DsbA family dithiol-disulfide isomerase